MLKQENRTQTISNKKKKSLKAFFVAAVFPFHNFATTNSKYFRISHAFPRLELSEGKVGRILKITFECQKGFIFSLVGGKENEKK